MFPHYNIISYIEMCNQVAFTKRLPLHPCKFSYWLVLKHVSENTHYEELVGLQNQPRHIRVYQCLTNRFTHFFPNIAYRKSIPDLKHPKDNLSQPVTTHYCGLESPMHCPSQPLSSVRGILQGIFRWDPSVPMSNRSYVDFFRVFLH